MKQSFLLPLACFALVTPAVAEIFTLKDGSKLEAKILKETPESYFLEVQVTKSIKDDKTVAKADVVKVEAEKYDEKAFVKIKSLVPTPDMLVTEEYDKRIIAVLAFIQEYPKSPLRADAETILATLKEEGSVVVGGGFKLGGKVITPEEYKADAYDIDARVLEFRIRAAYANGDFLGALRGIANMEKNFSATKSRKALVPLKRQILLAYQAQLNEQLATVDARKAERETGLARMSGENRARTQQAIDEERDQINERIKAERAREQIWITTGPYHKASLESALSTVEDELGATTSVIPLDGGKVYRDLLKTIETSASKSTIHEEFYKAEEVEMPEKYRKMLKAAAQAKGVEF